MKHLLLSGLCLAAVGVASAADFSVTSFTPQTPKHVNVPTVTNTVRINRPVRRALPEAGKNILMQAPARVVTSTAVDASAESAFYESFESWPIQDFDFTWLPEGWTAQRLCDPDDLESWFPFYQYNYSYPAPAEGQYYYMIMYSEDQQDEWLITPEIKLDGELDLSYYLYYQPFYLFSDANFDWDTYEYVGEKEIAATFKVMIKAEGDDEWLVLQDIADQYMDKSGYEILTTGLTGLEKQTVSLAEYAGKTVQLGFRYVGKNGDSMWFDAVRIGVGGLEDVSYALPAHTFYWGWNREFTSLGMSVAQVPVLSPVTFTNTSGENASYEWQYYDPQTGMDATSNDQENLTLVYNPEVTGAANLFSAPTLVASVPGKDPGIYAPEMIIQAGGKATIRLSSGRYEFSVFPFEFSDDIIGGYTVSDDEIGAMSIPVFGHNMHTNQYWYNYTANGDEDANPETCYNHLEGIANLYMPVQEETVVVNGVNVFGYGLISADAELKFSIYGLKSYDGMISTDPSDYKVVATKTIKGSDILYYEGMANQKDYMCLPFAFDAPAVVTPTEDYPAFFFMLEGFNSDAVEYFMPLQTLETPSCGMNIAYMLSHIDFQVATGRPAYYSVKSLRYSDNGDIVQAESAFAFGLDAEYPWLVCGVENVTIGVEESSVAIELASYYDGADLTVEASEGLVASVAGRYDECVLTIARASESSPAFDGVVTVKGPGVEVAVNVHVDEALAINDVINGAAVVTETYDIYGRRIENAANGIYIVKYNDGTVAKKVVK